MQFTALFVESIIFPPVNYIGFPGGLDSKKNSDSILGSGGSPGEGNGNPLQHSCQENPMDRGAWKATVHGVTKLWTPLSDQHFMNYIGPFVENQFGNI